MRGDGPSAHCGCVRRAISCLVSLNLCVAAAGCSDSKPQAASSSSQAQDPVSRLPDVVETLEPSVVTILTSYGLGSGVVFDSNGTIVTDNHVVAGPTPVGVA